jgi:hypothetical protein
MELDYSMGSDSFQNGRQMAGVKTGRAVGDQCYEGPPAHQSVYLRQIVHTKQVRPVHTVAIKLKSGGVI